MRRKKYPFCIENRVSQSSRTLEFWTARKNVFFNMDRQTLAFAITKWKDKGKICSWEMKSEKSFLITVLKLKMWTMILHQELSEWLGEVWLQKAKRREFWGDGILWNSASRGSYITLLLCQKSCNHAPKNKKKTYFSARKLKKKKKDNSKLQNILNFKVARCLANIHDFVNGSEWMDGWNCELTNYFKSINYWNTCC